MKGCFYYDGGREQHLERRLEAIRAELVGIRTGVLLFLEDRADSPDLSRTTNQIADACGMSVQGVGNVLLRLTRAKVVERTAATREAGGRYFTYRKRAA